MMPRIKGQLSSETGYFEGRNNVLRRTLITLEIFDLWLVLKAGQMLNICIKILGPMLEVICLMTLGAALFFMSTRNETNNVSCQEMNLKYKEGSALRIDDHSTMCTTCIDKELFSLKRETERQLANLKSKTSSLHMALRKMDAQIRHLNARGKITEELADFAAESVGGFVIATPNTESYYESNRNQISLFGIPIWKPNYFTPRKVIQPWTQAGECWAFRGSHGKIEIELPYLTMISHVSMEHIPVSLSITGKIDAAPKEFQVFGKYRNKYVTIDKFVYNIEGVPSQVFPVKEEFRQFSFKIIMLEVLSNWGNSEYTCIYRFKVHGKIVQH